MSVLAVGYSNGANMAASTLLLRPEVLGGGVLFPAQVPLEPAERPDLFDFDIPVFLSGGRADTLVPAGETERLARLLRAAGATVTVRWDPGGHALGQGAREAARRWLVDCVAAGVMERVDGSLPQRRPVIEHPLRLPAARP